MPRESDDTRTTVTCVSNRKELNEFIQVPRHIYAGNPHWSRPLSLLQRQELTAKHNPFFKHAEVKLFLARKNGRVIGRTSAQVDHLHNRVHCEQTGFFGFFECPDDHQAAAALTGAAGAWLKERGMERIRGPLSLSINGEAGILVEGFDSPPQFRMPYTPPYYADLLEGAGFQKIKDLFAWHFVWNSPSERALQSVSRLRQHPGVTVRIADMGKFRQEVRTILDIFNEAWSENWGFVPMTNEEAKKLGDDLKLIIDPNVAVVVEIEGRPAGMILGVPNLNEATRDLNGSLFPLGFLKLLWRIKRRKVRNGRVLLMGVRKEYRKREFAALPYLLIDEITRRGSGCGYQWAELSWTLEDNQAINAIISKMGCARYKTYRLYQKELV